MELQLPVPGSPAPQPVLPQRLPGHPEGAGLHHLCGEGQAGRQTGSRGSRGSDACNSSAAAPVQLALCIIHCRCCCRRCFNALWIAQCEGTLACLLEAILRWILIWRCCLLQARGHLPVPQYGMEGQGSWFTPEEVRAAGRAHTRQLACWAYQSLMSCTARTACHHAPWCPCDVTRGAWGSTAIVAASRNAGLWCRR